MKMKLKNLVTVAALVSVAFAAGACGKKDKSSGDGDGDGDGMGGGSTDSRIDDLEAEIEALKALLEDATESEIPELLEQLADAEERLAELENCANTGNCEGLDAVGDLSVLTDAYCDWVFECCSNDEVRATLGAAAGDAAGCKDMYADILARGNTTPYLPGYNVSFFEGPGDNVVQLATLAEMVQSGRVALDADAMEECAELTSAQSCGGADPVAPAECGEGEEASACSEVVIGLQGLSEPCAWPVECEEGLTCVSAAMPIIEGVCMPVAEEDDFCQSEDECQNIEGNLYCDEDDGVCKRRPTGDEDCEFADPSFNILSPGSEANQIVPCEPGFFCSPETSTCVAGCDALGSGDLCADSEQCGDSRYCDFGDADVTDMSQVGVCKAKLAPGATSADGSICLSGSVFMDTTDGNTVKCDGAGGDDCSFDDFAGLDCNSGSCVEATDVCRTKCDAQYDCADGETCVNNVCYESVDANEDCSVTEQCPSNQYCNGTSCENKGGEGDDCDEAEQCVADFACVAGECHPFDGLGEDGYCTDWFHCTSERCDQPGTACLNTADLLEEGDACNMNGLDTTNINEDPCGPGLFCKQEAPNTTNFDGVCTAQLAPGSACDRSLPASVNQCVGNQTCATNNETGKLSCRVPYTEPDQHESCVLPVFRVETAYGDSGTYPAPVGGGDGDGDAVIVIPAL